MTASLDRHKEAQKHVHELLKFHWVSETGRFDTCVKANLCSRVTVCNHAESEAVAAKLSVTYQYRRG